MKLILSHSDKAVLCLKLKSDEVEAVQPTGESRSVVVVVTAGPGMPDLLLSVPWSLLSWLAGVPRCRPITVNNANLNLQTTNHQSDLIPS